MAALNFVATEVLQLAVAYAGAGGGGTGPGGEGADVEGKRVFVGELNGAGVEDFGTVGTDGEGFGV